MDDPVAATLDEISRVFDQVREEARALNDAGSGKSVSVDFSVLESLVQRLRALHTTLCNYSASGEETALEAVHTAHAEFTAESGLPTSEVQAQMLVAQFDELTANQAIMGGLQTFIEPGEVPDLRALLMSLLHLARTGQEVEVLDAGVRDVAERLRAVIPVFIRLPGRLQELLSAIDAILFDVFQIMLGSVFSNAQVMAEEEGRTQEEALGEQLQQLQNAVAGDHGDRVLDLVETITGEYRRDEAARALADILEQWSPASVDGLQRAVRAYSRAYDPCFPYDEGLVEAHQRLLEKVAEREPSSDDDVLKKYWGSLALVDFLRSRGREGGAAPSQWEEQRLAWLKALRARFVRSGDDRDPEFRRVERDLNDLYDGLIGRDPGRWLRDRCRYAMQDSRARVEDVFRHFADSLDAGAEGDQELVALLEDYARQRGNDAVNGLRELVERLERLGRFAEAEVFYRVWTGVRPQYDEAWHGLAQLLLRRGRGAEAVGVYEEALARADDWSFLANNKAFTLYREGCAEEAVKCLNQVIEYQQSLRQRDDEGSAEPGPRFTPLYYCYALDIKATCLRQLGRGEQALGCYDEILSIRPDDGDALRDRGAAYAELGRDEEAIADFERVLELDPDATDLEERIANLRQAS